MYDGENAEGKKGDEASGREQSRAMQEMFASDG